MTHSLLAPTQTSAGMAISPLKAMTTAAVAMLSWIASSPLAFQSPVPDLYLSSNRLASSHPTRTMQGQACHFPACSTTKARPTMRARLRRRFGRLRSITALSSLSSRPSHRRPHPHPITTLSSLASSKDSRTSWNVLSQMEATHRLSRLPSA